MYDKTVAEAFLLSFGIQRRCVRVCIRNEQESRGQINIIAYLYVILCINIRPPNRSKGIIALFLGGALFLLSSSSSRQHSSTPFFSFSPLSYPTPINGASPHFIYA